MLVLVTFLLCQFLVPGVANSVNACYTVFEEESSVPFGSIVSSEGLSTLRQHDYVQHRSFTNYSMIFRGLHADLNKTGVWLDSGAGYGYPLRTYLSDLKNGSMKVVGVVYETSPQRVQWESFDQRSRLKWFEGRKIEGVQNHEIGKVDVISDLLGPFVYSDQPDVILRKYLSLIQNDGTIYFAFERSSKVIVHGKEMSMWEWLEQLDWKGAKVTIAGQKNFGGLTVPPTVQVVTNAQSAEISIPGLRLVERGSGSPPKMIFEQLP